MGPPLYMRSIVNWNVVMQHMTVVEESQLLTHSPRTLFAGYQLPYTQQTWQDTICGSEDCPSDQL